MKKVDCEKCGSRRGRRQCVKYNKLICGECCSDIQLNSNCPKSCIHLGKYSTKDLNEKIHALIDIGIDLRTKKPDESIKLFDRALELDGRNTRSLVEKSITYDSLGKYDKSIECLEEAYAIGYDNSIYLSIASSYKKIGDYQKSIDMLSNLKDRERTPGADFLFGECLYLAGQYKRSIECMKKALENPQPGKFYNSKTRAILARSYMALKEFDKAIDAAEFIDQEYEDEKNSILESAYFANGRMYELLCLINSMENIGYEEKFLLLQCALALKKNTGGDIVAIIDDILKGSCFARDSYEEISLIGIKIRLLFKELNMRQAYEVFVENEDRLIGMVKDCADCREACALIAFFLYGFDKKRSLYIYSIITGEKIDEFVLDELYNAFSTMDISPYIRARALVKSIELMRDGKDEGFSRTSIAADILYDLSEYSQASDLYKRVINVEKPDAVTVYKMAVSLMNQGMFAEALEEFKTVLSLTRFIPGVYSGAIRCSLELSYDWSEYFKRLELDKLSFKEIYELAGSLLIKGCYDKAGYLLSFIIEKYEGMDIYSRKMVYQSLACVYRNLRDYSSGIQLLNQIPQKYSGDYLLLDLGCLYADTGELDSAMGIFEALKEGPLRVVVSFNMGVLRVKLKDYAGALDYFNTSIKYVSDTINKRQVYDFGEYSEILNKLYRNSGICLAEIDRVEDALISSEKALNIKDDEKTADILTAIQEMLLNQDRGIKSNQSDIGTLSDECIMLSSNFTEDIKSILDDILRRVYGKCEFREYADESGDAKIAEFIANERRIYNKNRDSIERSEGTFQRYVDNLMLSFEKRVIAAQQGECAAKRVDLNTPCTGTEYADMLINLGDSMISKFEYTKGQDYINACLIPYFKIVKILSKDKILPYYKKNLDNLPVPKDCNSFRDLGIYLYNTGGVEYFRVDFSYNISCCKYLFEINCHPGLRSKYFDFKRHYMPWNKLIWMISGIKRKWDVVDDAKSAGLMLLFYSGFKDYLEIGGNFKNREDIIRLAGDLIQLSNERDYCMRIIVRGDFEFDYLGYAKNVRDLALRCINGLQKITEVDKN